MAYTKQTWADHDPNYPLSAARMGHIEDGIFAAYVAGAGGLVNADISATAAIAKSKLASLAIGDADVSSISASKITAAATAYTTTWAASGTQPALGNGSLAASYIQIGKLVSAFIDLTMGSTTTYGTGTYTFSLPVAASTSGVVGGTALAFQGGNFFFGFSTLNSSTTLSVYTPAQPGVLFGPAVPITWANGNIFRVQVTYPAA